MSSWPSGYALLELQEVDSTNEEARRRAAAGERGPLWIIAERQTQGRGRRGRVWISLPGNLAATLLLRPNRPAAECAQLSFVAALALSDILTRYIPGADIGIKWPNDVFVEERKISGILLESESGPGADAAWLAVGIGVNLASFPDELHYPTTSVRALIGSAPSPKDALLDLAEAFAKWYEAWRTSGFGSIREVWLSRAQRLGRQVRVRLPNEEIWGVFQDIDNTGSLVLGLRNGTTRTISAGEIYF